MRKLYFLRGLPGSGKSTFLTQAGLQAHTLSTDALRLIVQHPILTDQGRMGTSQSPVIWKFFSEILEGKMSRGETIFVDATHTRPSEWKDYLELAAKSLYKVACVDFSAVPFDVCQARNIARVDYKVVPEKDMLRLAERLKSTQLPEDMKVFKVDPDNLTKTVNEIKAEINPPVRDYSTYTNVVFIGDLQGCVRQLKVHPLLKDGPQENTRYVFMGDICDRGPENGAALKWVLKNYAHKPNVDFIYGNHELHLQRWSKDLPAVSKEFEFNTQPQLVESGITKEQVAAWCDTLQDGFLMKHGKNTVLVTHAGLPFLPESGLGFVSLEELNKGVGGYESPVDEQFTTWVKEGKLPEPVKDAELYQVHGHRNTQCLPIVSPATERSFNLEGKVEFGGDFRLVNLDVSGFTPILIHNPFIRTMRDDKSPASTESKPAWISKPNSSFISPEDLASLRKHTLIKEKVMTESPHISSFNFTRDAFYDKAWDATNVTARGLFINNKSGEIVARSYDKFFNIGERPETQPESLEKNLKFPVSVFVKENGYLGILGYDAETASPFFASKSTSTGPFSDLFKKIYSETIPPESQAAITAYLSKSESTLVFEVIDPINDPHMIDYDKPHLVLLDAVHRSTEFERLPFTELKEVSAKLGLKCKERGMTFKDWPSLNGFLKVTQDPNYMHKGANIEGYVLEDAEGFQTKLKLPFYSQWKYFRSLKDRVSDIKEQEKGFLKPIEDPAALKFVAWCNGKTAEELKAPILKLRKDYQADIAKGVVLPDASALFKPREKVKKPYVRPEGFDR